MIGIFDSGFGGLVVLGEVIKVLPNYDYVYLGDNARAPYGDLSQDVIYKYTKQAVDYLFSYGCSLIILACNTVSAEALRKLQQEYLPLKYPDKNILGIIRPLSEIAAKVSRNKKIVVLATNSTVNSHAYPIELQGQDNRIIVLQQACPLLVNLVEKSQEWTVEAKEILNNYLKLLDGKDFDTLILGCTHYSFFHDQIDGFFKKRIKIINNGKAVAQKLADYIKHHSEFVKTSGSKKTLFLTTGDSAVFDEKAKKFLGYNIKSNKIKL